MELIKNKWDRILERGTILFYLAGVFLVLILWDRLPARVPVYFNWPGKVEGLAGPTVYFETLLLMGLLSFGVYKLSRNPVILSSYSNPKTGQTQYANRLMYRMLQSLNLASAFTWFILSLSSLQNAMETRVLELSWLVPCLPFLLMGIPLIYGVRILRWKWGLINHKKP
jgi:hypothetical protein